MSTPVYIINRNRLSTTQALANWLREAGTERIVVLDNDSSYEPLLEWYERKEVEVVKIGRNGGPLVFWELKMNDSIHEPYIVTDSDLVPSDICPKDLVTKLGDMLNQHTTYHKIGAGLRLDNLPPTPWKAGVISSQQPYWAKPLNAECFIAYVDTTFAIYRGHFVDSSGPALRMNTPYLMDHMPWYVWPLTEEEKYYRAHADGICSMIDNEPYFRFV